MAHSEDTIEAALAEYVTNEITTKAIAKKHGVSASTITVWATTKGLPLRSRGRRKLDEPSMRQQEIIQQASVCRYEEVGRRFGITKQAVQQVLRRWKSYAKPKRPPFEPGDIITWRGQTFRVISAEISSGTIMNDKGQLLRCCVWNSEGRMPVKIGADPRYQVRHLRSAA
jgi:transposase